MLKFKSMSYYFYVDMIIYCVLLQYANIKLPHCIYCLDPFFCFLRIKSKTYLIDLVIARFVPIYKGCQSVSIWEPINGTIT